MFNNSHCFVVIADRLKLLGNSITHLYRSYDVIGTSLYYLATTSGTAQFTFSSLTSHRDYHGPQTINRCVFRGNLRFFVSKSGKNLLSYLEKGHTDGDV